MDRLPLAAKLIGYSLLPPLQEELSIPVQKANPLFTYQRLVSDLKNGIRSSLDDEARRYIALSKDEPYIHENGFCKFTLAKSKTRRLRLHYWPRGDYDRTNGSIHTHRFSFQSYVVKGLLSEKTYIEDKITGKILNKYMYPAGSASSDYALTLEGTSRLVLSQERAVAAGEDYKVQSNEIHKAFPAPGSGPLVTLILAEYDLSAPDVYVYAEEIGDISVSPEKIRKEKIWEPVRLLLNGTNSSSYLR